MASAANSMNTHRREDSAVQGDLKDLEGPINEVAQLARIAANFGDELLDYSRAERKGDVFVFTLTKEDLEDMAFLAGEAQHRARLLRDGFYVAVHGRAL